MCTVPVHPTRSSITNIEYPARVAAVHIEGHISVTLHVLYLLDTLCLMSELTRRGSKKGASQVSVSDVASV